MREILYTLECNHPSFNHALVWPSIFLLYIIIRKRQSDKGPGIEIKAEVS